MSYHAIDELTKDGLTEAHAVNAIKAGAVEPAELEAGRGAIACTPCACGSSSCFAA